MSDSPVNEQPPTRWSLSRIISAVILLIIVVVGISYGIYDLTSKGSNSANHSVSNGSHLVNPTPPTSTKNKSTTTNTKGVNNPAISTNANTNNATKQTTSTSPTTPAVSSNKLTNTGPGDVAVIGFIGAFSIGFAIHYSWRRRHINS